ncbi:hypothetical protein C8J56DRAFT_365412 [Mycena floridula]|nr:hypothetical protein C8J56DRAFT_365412 [Mycena floridula]
MAFVSVHLLLLSFLIFFSRSAQAHMFNFEDISNNAVALPVQTAAITLTPQQPNFAFDLESVLPSASSTISNLTELPQNCAAYNKEGSECPGVMEASSVTFDDCGSAFTICRCTTANMTLNDAVDKLSRVPVGLRRYVATVVLLSDSAPHAYTLTTGDIHMFAFTEMDTWIHEAAHAYDYATSTPVSGTTDWLQALASDSCVPDEYSQTNAIEDFAQVTVLKMFALTHGGNYPPGYSTDCMKNQLAFVNSHAMFDPKTLFGDTCDLSTETSSATGTTDGARHTVGPATLRTTNSYPLPYTMPDPVATTTSAPSGFRKVPMPVPTVAAVGADPNRSKNAGGKAVSPVGLLYFYPVLGFLGVMTMV